MEYLDGPALVIAGAGSGKTRVLTYKIVHLLHHGYEPWRILALTFTNKAAREMRERIEQLVGPKTSSRLWMGTFHSIFARLLRSHADRLGFKPSFTIYDTADSKSLIKLIIKEMDLDDKIYKPSTVMGAISAAKNALISPTEYAQSADIMEADKRARRPLLYAIYQRYRDRCFAAGAMDFDDLLYYTNLLLRDNPDILHHYQEYFRYVLVDEYQDTNYAQHVIVSQLTRQNEQLCVVGDDAQSIYSFRGANIRNILNLKNGYPRLAIFKLEQNYRSTQNIINAANSLIEKNQEQIRKHVFSRNEEGKRVKVVQTFSDYDEAFQVANTISEVKMTCRDSYEEFAILYRTNAQSRLLEETLRKRNIPYRIYGGLSFYQRKEVKDAIAYMRLTVNPNDDEALRRIINYPTRGIGETTLNRLMKRAVEEKVSIWEILSNLAYYNPGVSGATVKKLDAFRMMMEGFIRMHQQGKDALEVTREIISKTGLLAMFISDRTPESIAKRDNVEELINGVREMVEERQEEGEGRPTSLVDFLGEVSLATDQDSDDGSDERVTLMTVHAAKGLEFNNVIIVGVEEDLFPSAMSSGSMSEIEEERRLLYVALTRARKFCMMTYAKSRFRNGMTALCQPSRFLRDIDGRYLLLSSSSSDGGGGGGINPAANYKSSFHSSPTRWSTKGSASAFPSMGKPSSGAAPQPSAPPSASSSSTATGLPGLHSIKELQEGMVIEHVRFGKGTIESLDDSNGDAIVVSFESCGVKKLLLKFAKFNIVS